MNTSLVQVYATDPTTSTRFTRVIASNNESIITEQLLDDKIVAMKEVRGQDTTWLSEVSFMQMFSHPNIVDLLAIVVNPVAPFAPNLILERAQSDLLDYGVIDLQMVYQMTMGLAHLHSLGYIHGDVKPDNYFIFSDGTIKLADFGLTVPEIYARKGIPAYTSDYRPPEVVEAVASDIWALGVTILTIVAGERIFVQKTNDVWLPLFESDDGAIEPSNFYVVANEQLDKIDKPLQHLTKEMIRWNPIDRLTARQILLGIQSNDDIPAIYSRNKVLELKTIPYPTPTFKGIVTERVRQVLLNWLYDVCQMFYRTGWNEKRLFFMAACLYRLHFDSAISRNRYRL